MTSDLAAPTLSWTPRAAELAEASLARNRETGGSAARAVVSLVMALLAATMLTQRLTVALGIVLITLALVLAFFRVTLPMQRRRWSAVLAANPALAETCELTVDEHGVHLSSDRVTSTRRWAGFTSWTDAPGALVLATSDTPSGLVLVIPHRASENAEERDAVRRVVEAHLGPALGAGPGQTSRRWWPWAVRAAVIACLVVPLGTATLRNHDVGGEWRPWPSEAPPVITRDAVEYQREGGPTGRPTGATGSDYTPGGGLVLAPFSPAASGPAAELWVLDHEGVVRHYVP